MTAADFTSPWLRYAHGRSIMMPFSTRFLQGVPGSSDCINPCAENIIAGETDPAAPVPSEPDLPANGEALRDERGTPDRSHRSGSASEMVARRPPLERLGTRISAADARRLYCSN